MRTVIRLAEPADAEAIAAIYRPAVEEDSASFEVVAPDATEMARRVQETMPTYPWLVAVIEGTVAGYAYGTRHRARAAYRWSVETSVYIGEPYRRRGVASGLYQSLFAILAAQGYVNLFAGITLPNPASVRTHESLGFRPIGVFHHIGFKFGQWHDVGWWERLLEPHSANPGEVVSLDDLRERNTWATLFNRGLRDIR